MWFLYTVIGCFFMALVAYSDEYLTHSTTIKPHASLHERIGGVFIISTMLCVVGMGALWGIADTVMLPPMALNISLVSAVPMIITWVGYFYLLQLYSAHQVIPLFGLTSAWLLPMELFFGGAVTLLALLGIIILAVGAYLLDSGGLKLKLPSKLIYAMSFISFCWALTIYLVRDLSTEHGVYAIYFWQLVGVFAIGVLLFAFVRPYREGFIRRVKTEKWHFILPSFMNEAFSQVAFLFTFLAIALAPLATYVTALAGLESLFLLVALRLFPLDDRNDITSAQWGGVGCLAAGVALLEVW